MAIQLGISLGLSFAEFCLVDGLESLHPRVLSRHYLPAEQLTPSLRTFLSKNKDLTPARVIVASRFLEKILDTRLGGSVAQVVTRGFENWPLLRQPLQSPFFELVPARTEPLASQELIFGISERVDHEGKVLQPLSLQELDFITAKLKMMEVSRVCVNLLFAHKNPTHQQMAASYFQEKGFEVFSATAENTETDEVLSWRKNVLNACLAGTFSEVKAEIFSGCEGFVNPDRIYFLDGAGHLFQNDGNSISSSLFGTARALKSHGSSDSNLLWLGLESWALLPEAPLQTQWQSPWGPLAGAAPQLIPLRLQPTTELIVNDFRDFSWAPQSLGFEPGPALFGRGLRPTAFDVLFFEANKEEIPWISETGRKKFQGHLLAMTRHSSLSGRSPQQIIDQLRSDLVDQIALQVLLEQASLEKPVVCTGFMAPLLTPLLKQRWPEIKWELSAKAQEAEALAAATWGLP